MIGPIVFNYHTGKLSSSCYCTVITEARNWQSKTSEPNLASCLFFLVPQANKKSCYTFKKFLKIKRRIFCDTRKLYKIEALVSRILLNPAMALIYLLSLMVFIFQQPSWRVATETAIWPKGYLLTGPLQRKFASSCLKLPNFSI